MRFAVDTNVLVRACVEDDAEQAAQARECLDRADMLFISLTTLCEFVWVLMRVYKVATDDVITTIQRLMQMQKVVTDRTCVDFALEVLRLGGDFADGVIAFDSSRLGADTFLSFDRNAVSRVRQAGMAAVLVQEG